MSQTPINSNTSPNNQKADFGTDFPKSSQDAKRIAILEEYQLLNHDNEPAFSRLTELARLFFDIPMVSITFMDEHTQYLKAPVGLGEMCQTTRQDAFCNYTILSDEVLVVRDALKDERFANNNLVVNPPHLRFYAGAPITVHEDGQDIVLGAFCLLDTQPHPDFADKYVKRLVQFAHMAGDALQMRKNQRLARQASVMKSKFLANMSHEIRTPMNGILGMVDLLAETPLNDEQKNYVHNLQASTEHLMAIINDILDLSKVESGKMSIHAEPMNLKATCDAVQTMFRSKAMQRQIKLHYDYDTQLSDHVLGDSVRITQVLSNLINNALKFTPEGGEVTLAVHADSYCQKHHTHVLRKHGQGVCITVADTGIGIAPESLVAIFDAYNQADKQTHKMYGGTGLGLSVSRALVTAMGGEISVQSEVGQGTTFMIQLPLPSIEDTDTAHTQMSRELMPEGKVLDHASGDQPSHHKWASDQPTAPKPTSVPNTPNTNNIISELPADESHGTKRCQILLVEDDAVNALIAKKALQKGGHVVTHVTDGQQAIDKLTDTTMTFDVVLMDHHMPIMDGVTATQRLHAMSVDLPPIIALTANAMAGEREKYLEAGMVDYATKPFKPDELNALVAKWVS